MPWMPIDEGMRALLAGAASGFAAFAQAAAPLAVAALWQGAVLAVVLGLGLAAAQRARMSLAAAQRFLLWTGVFLLVIALPLLPLLAPCLASVPAPANAVSFAGTAASSGARSWPRLPQIQLAGSWALAIGALWLTFSLFRLIVLLAHALRLRRLWKSATPVAAGVPRFSVANSASTANFALFSFRRAAELCTTRELDRPAVIGFLAPRILLPEWLFARLTPAELDQVVLHEAEHLRRRDDWTNLLGKFALVLFPLNPVLVWIERRLAREREMACDEAVVRRTQQPCAYAACLTRLAGHAIERRRAHALSLGAFERQSELARRVTTLLARRSALHPLAAYSFAVLTASGLLAASVGLARCPRMVAFAPAAPPAAAQEAMTPAGAPIPQADDDRAGTELAFARGASGFRAVQAMAILPAHRRVSSFAAPRCGASSSARSNSTGPNLTGTGEPVRGRTLSRPAMNDAAPTESQAAEAWAATPPAQAADAVALPAVAPQLVVFTAWREIDTAPNRSGATSGDAPGFLPSADGNDKNTARPAVAIAVTRLVFWIAPRPNAAWFAAPAPGSGPSRAMILHSRRPPALVPASGWLVFEL